MLAAVCHQLDQPVRVEEVDLDEPELGEVQERCYSAACGPIG
jgi:Zn-dependent alcohol dehydrogenase